MNANSKANQPDRRKSSTPNLTLKTSAKKSLKRQKINLCRTNLTGKFKNQIRFQANLIENPAHFVDPGGIYGVEAESKWD